MTHIAATTLSIRIQSESREKLEALSQATGRTKSFLAAEAIDYYLEVQSWQVNAIQEAILQADGPAAEFVENQKVMKWLNSWGSENETDIP